MKNSFVILILSVLVLTTSQASKDADGSGPNEPLDLNSCVTGGAVFMTNAVCVWETNGAWIFSFDVMGGTNGLVYDVFSTTNPAGKSTWLWVTNSFTCQAVVLVLADQTKQSSFYMLGTPQDSDSDGVTDACEQFVSNTDPNNPDSDGDGTIDQPFKVIITRPGSHTP